MLNFNSTDCFKPAVRAGRKVRRVEWVVKLYRAGPDQFSVANKFPGPTVPRITQLSLCHLIQYRLVFLGFTVSNVDIYRLLSTLQYNTIQYNTHSHYSHNITHFSNKYLSITLLDNAWVKQC